MKQVEEINFDGIVGPTHHYGGYAYGNLASMRHRHHISHPKKAALQGLKKMKMLADLKVSQAVMPPRMRPSLPTLRSLGFTGNDLDIFAQAAHTSPSLLQILCSSSAMWTANCATFSPSSDTADGKVHMTVANLQSQFHRAIESDETFRLLNLLFPDKELFIIHPPLPKGGHFGDEGAANHSRVCTDYGAPGVHLFVYSQSAFDTQDHLFPFRQAREASEAIARLHGLNAIKTVFAKQNPAVIELGFFHNDVICVGNRFHLLYHEQAFTETEHIISTLSQLSFLKPICVTEKMFPLHQALKSYLFNSQIVTLPGGEDVVIAPSTCESLRLDWLPLRVSFVDVSESMHGGGGPACLRWRAVLTHEEKKCIHPFVFLDDHLYEKLTAWVERYYRDRLTLDDLLDPTLLQEVMEALDTLTQILHLGSFYDFQCTCSYP
jgi:succinylarginine dihydrolase